MINGSRFTDEPVETNIENISGDNRGLFPADRAVPCYTVLYYNVVRRCTALTVDCMRRFFMRRGSWYVVGIVKLGCWGVCLAVRVLRWALLYCVFRSCFFFYAMRL